MARIIKEIKPSVIPMPKLMRAAAYARVSCGKGISHSKIIYLFYREITVIYLRYRAKRL